MDHSLLIPGISPLHYYSSQEHKYLHGHEAIGANGENLTITFLSMNRSELSIRLLSSIKKHIPHFQGEILIIDNHSLPNELNKIKNACYELPLRSRIIELTENRGVAGGRNEAIRHIKTDWCMFLDNDLYLIGDPLQAIQGDLLTQGCHFLNLPLLQPDEKKVFSFGGHIYVTLHEGQCLLGAGSCFEQTNKALIEQTIQTPFLSTFLYGGASVVKRDTFLRLGGFDEQLFIGFEDTDFSIRLFREGYKVGNTSQFFFVHDHPAPETIQEKDYEKKRYSPQIIESSARYLEEKYHYKFWTDNVKKWIKKKNHSLKTNRKKIALILDVDYGPHGNIARQLLKHLDYEFEFVVVVLEQIKWSKKALIEKTADCDILHFFWRETIPVIYPQYVKNTGKIISTCVYDHLFLNDVELRNRRKIFQHASYYVSSERLKDIYCSIDDYSRPVLVIEDGVDPDLFYPINLERFQEYDRPLIIGWVGNSNWGGADADHKGFRSYVKPAIEQLIASGFSVEGNYCDRAEHFVPHHEMVHYYSQVDVVVCMSLNEGTPNPLLEAMACGVPVITTDVGIVPQVLGEAQKEFIIQRDIEELKERILKLLMDRSKLKDLSEENLGTIKHWHWQGQCLKFKKYFFWLLEKLELHKQALAADQNIQRRKVPREKLKVREKIKEKLKMKKKMKNKKK